MANNSLTEVREEIVSVRRCRGSYWGYCEYI
jgi:hypothetical protein